MKRSSRGYGLAEQRTRRAAPSDWTNDSQEDGEGHSESSERIEIRNGYPVRFKCMDAAITQSLDANLLQVSYDYELSIARNSASSFKENMRAFEWSVLWNVVDEIGLGKCDFSQQTLALATGGSNDGIRRRGRRRRRTQQLSDVASLDTEPSYILSMASDAEDVMDVDTAICQFTSDVDPENICVPIKGAMTILYTGNKPEMMERFMLEKIQGVMEQNIVLVEDIQRTTFVGDRDSRNGGIQRGIIEPGPIESEKSSFGLGVGFSVCVGFIGIAMMGLFVGYKLRRKHQQGLRDLEEDNSLDKGPPNLEEHRSSKSANLSGGDTEDFPGSESYTFTGEFPPELLEQGRTTFAQQSLANQSVYLASNRQRKRKKGGGKKRKNSLRERVSMAPSGIEPIPEAEGDFESSLHEKDLGESSDFSWSTDEGEEGNSKNKLLFSPTNFPNARASLQLPNSSPSATHIFFADSNSSSGSPDSARSDLFDVRSIKDTEKKEQRPTPKIRPLPLPWV